jgi:Tfp pilus assembly protein PilZ
VHSVSINLEAAQYLAGYRREARALFLPTLSESRVGDEVAVRVGIYGQPIRATLFGKVSLVRRVGRRRASSCSSTRGASSPRASSPSRRAASR